MTIRKTKQGTYSVEVFYPKEVRMLFDGKRYFRKTVKKLAEAQNLDRETQTLVDNYCQDGSSAELLKKGDTNFKVFVETVWFPGYGNGNTGRTRKMPKESTLSATRRLFKNQIIPMFGEYSLRYLNDHKQDVFQALVNKSQEFANIRQICSYLNQVFEYAEFLEYINMNRIRTVITHVSQPKKDKLISERRSSSEYLSADQLLEWLNVLNFELQSGNISMCDYTMFYTTLFIGDRKSETYGLQWKHVDFQSRTITIEQSLSNRRVQTTKGNKLTRLTIPVQLVGMLSDWKKTQYEILKPLGIEQTGSQFLFTYSDSKGYVNQPVHPDYLNLRLKKLEKWHPELPHLYPHMLRHTFATLARQGGAKMEDISRALTHSEIGTTKIYVNTPDEVDLTIFDHFYKRLEEQNKKPFENMTQIVTHNFK